MSRNLCECGCGQPAGVYASSGPGRRAGEPKRFIHGHNTRRSLNPRWRGGKWKTSRGYRRVLRPGHPRADNKGYVLEHLLVAERALGRPVELPHVVHHVNGDTLDNRPENLVICEDQAYHLKIERRTPNSLLAKMRKGTNV